MSVDSKELARKLLVTVPPVMQTLVTDLRRSGTLLTPAHLGVLAVLGQHPANLSELAEHQAVSLPTMSSTIKTLVDKGWVNRTRSKIDRRIVIVELTEEGRKTLGSIQERAETILITYLEYIPEEDRKKLWSGLTVLCRMFEINESTEAE